MEEGLSSVDFFEGYMPRSSRAREGERKYWIRKEIPFLHEDGWEGAAVAVDTLIWLPARKNLHLKSLLHDDFETFLKMVANN